MVGNVIVQYEFLLISIFQFFRPQKNMKLIQNLTKITCTSPYREECDSEIWIISDFCAHKKFWSWPLAAILKFESIFKKSLAHPHVARNVMLKFEKKLTKQIFCVLKIKVDLWRPF